MKWWLIHSVKNVHTIHSRVIKSNNGKDKNEQKDITVTQVGDVVHSNSTHS